MKNYFCWRCDEIMPFLEEHEWKKISALYYGFIKTILKYRKKHNCDLETARAHCEKEATEKFEELTGISGVSIAVMYHHRLKDWGKECSKCGYLFRTPKAKRCTNCGSEKNEYLYGWRERR